LILAPGVYDRPLPFPGWTLPGVITPGAAQMLLKRQGLLPGKRILIAGTGPLQLAVAANLANAGAEVVACIDACAGYEALDLAPLAFWGQWSRLGEFAGYIASLFRRRVPLHFRQAIRYAEGDAESGVTAAYVGAVDSLGRPTAGATRAYQVDTICCSTGFLPSIQLTLHLGCRHVYSPMLGAFVPQHDERMQTDRCNVFVAGDVTGVGGKPLAELQGRLAALSALESLGKLSAAQAKSQRAALAPAIAGERRFERFLWQRYRFREGMLGALSDDTVLCRCENVTLGELRESFHQGARTITGAKGRTRLGMGLCQGRYCVANANAVLAGLGQLSPDEVGLMHIRPPVVPVRIQDIAYLEEL
jgi:NADPH-dependent 2,4-dienoyl-CoA reductase/sulfur reductase-like enzyme